MDCSCLFAISDQILVSQRMLLLISCSRSTQVSWPVSTSALVSNLAQPICWWQFNIILCKYRNHPLYYLKLLTPPDLQIYIDHGVRYIGSVVPGCIRSYKAAAVAAKSLLPSQALFKMVTTMQHSRLANQCRVVPGWSYGVNGKLAVSGAWLLSFHRINPHR